MDHTVRAYDEELDALTTDVDAMGQRAIAALQEAVAAVLAGDTEKAEKVLAGDAAIDALEIDIEHKAIGLIARRQPVGPDLRRVVAAMKVAANLERCGDLANSVAKRTPQIDRALPGPVVHAIERLGVLVDAALSSVMMACRTRDLDAAVEVWMRDEEVDAAYNGLFRELLTCMTADARMITTGSHLLYVAKNLERIGDHATNIAELVHYELTGSELVGAQRPRAPAGG